MAKPFEHHIPYFPGEEKGDLPNPETTIFNNDGVITSIDLIQAYASPISNSKIRSGVTIRIKDFCFDAEQFDTFRQTLLETIESAERFNTIDSTSRVRILQDLYSRVDEAYLRSDYMGVNNSKPGIPEGVSNENAELIPRIHLANEVLRRAFPEDFGNVITQIVSSDFIVVRDNDLLRFQKDDARYMNHPFRRNAVNEYNQKIGSKGKYSHSKKEGQVMIQVVTSAEGMPILYPLSATDMQHAQLSTVDREIALDFTMVSAILHENFHRSSKPRSLGPLPPGSNMLELGFGPEENQLEEMERKSDPNTPYFRELIEQLKQYTVNNDPEVIIDGARVQIWCNDESGIKRAITDSGHDLNEAIVEALTYTTLPHFLDYVYKKYGNTPSVQKLVAMQNDLAFSDVTYRHGNLMAFVVPYLRRLGLDSPQATLHAYSQGKIPEFHATKIPQEKYMY